MSNLYIESIRREKDFEEDDEDTGYWYYLTMSDGGKTRFYASDRENIEATVKNFINMFNDFADGYKIVDGRIHYE